MTDLLDQTVGTQSLEDAPDLRRGLAGQQVLQVAALEAAQVELTSDDGFQDGTIVIGNRLKPR